MQVEVKFFAICREIAGTDSMKLELPDGATDDDFWQKVIEKFPRLAPYKEHSRLAVNMEYVRNPATFKEGDEICIIPPVSGG